MAIRLTSREEARGGGGGGGGWCLEFRTSSSKFTFRGEIVEVSSDAVQPPEPELN